MGMGKDLTPNLGRSWPSCPWGSQKNMRRVCDREGDLVSLVILHIYEGNLHILLVPIVCPSTGFPKVGLPELGPKRPSVATWQKWTTSRAHGLRPWEAPVSGNSFFVCLCCPFCLWWPPSFRTRLVRHDAGTFPGGSTSGDLLQPLSLSLKEHFLTNLISSKQNAIPFLGGSVLAAW